MRSKLPIAALFVALCAGSAFAQPQTIKSPPQPAVPAEHNQVPIVDVNNPFDQLARGSINKPLVVQPAPTDPSQLTTAQLYHEIETIRAELSGREAYGAKVNETRFDGMDKAIKLLQDLANRTPTTEAVDLKVGGLEKLSFEKFKQVETQFALRDLQVQQNAAVAEKAVGAALQAAKEAVSEQNKSNATAMLKSEAAFTKQIDQQQLLLQQTTKASDEKIDDLKSRLNAIEGHSKGTGDSWGFLVGAAAISAFVVMLITLVLNRGKVVTP